MKFDVRFASPSLDFAALDVKLDFVNSEETEGCASELDSRSCDWGDYDICIGSSSTGLTGVESLGTTL